MQSMVYDMRDIKSPLTLVVVALPMHKHLNLYHALKIPMLHNYCLRMGVFLHRECHVHMICLKPYYPYHNTHVAG